jgi:predicted DNA-binding transcriptional regulator YafY
LENKKLNNGCLKIFYFLNLLYEDKAFYPDVKEIFKDDINEQSANNIQVVINKYINTLKVFGIKIVKQKNKYVLQSSLYSMNFTLEDLKSISILTSSIQNFPDEEIGETIKEFIQNIQLRMKSEDKLSLNNIAQTKNYNFSFQYLELRKQIEQCKQYCKKNQTLNIVYLKNKQEIHTKCTPKELIYDSRNAYFKLYDITTKQDIEIPITNILKIEENPQIAKSEIMTQTVVFRVKNRLAKTYKLKENEYSDGFDENGNQTIINKNEPKEKLLQRLMRYGSNCEIISPKNLRNELIELINKTLNMYE